MSFFRTRSLKREIVQPVPERGLRQCVEMWTTRPRTIDGKMGKMGKFGRVAIRKAFPDTDSSTIVG